MCGLSDGQRVVEPRRCGRCPGGIRLAYPALVCVPAVRGSENQRRRVVEERGCLQRREVAVFLVAGVTGDTETGRVALTEALCGLAEAYAAAVVDLEAYGLAGGGVAVAPSPALAPAGATRLATQPLARPDRAVEQFARVMDAGLVVGFRFACRIAAPPVEFGASHPASAAAAARA